MINDKQLLFIGEYVMKGKTGKSNKTIGSELGVSERTIMRWLQDDEIKREINRRCANSIDTMLPALISNAENMIHSSNPNERAKGNDMALKLMDRLKVQEELSVIERERILIESFIESCVTNSLFLKDIDSKLFLEVCVAHFTKTILLKGYESPPMTAREIEDFLNQAVAYQESLNREELHRN